MDLCSHYHVQIAHEEGRMYCPLCEANSEIEDLKQQIVDLEEQVKNLEE